MKITFKPSGVCCREMSFEVDDNNIITDIDFIGGCPGNLLGLKSLVIGQNAHDVANKLAKYTMWWKWLHLAQIII